MSTKIVIELTVEGDAEEIVERVDALLDNGALQAEVIEACADEDVDIEITNATVYSDDGSSDEVLMHCTRGCADIGVTREQATAGKCPHCGGDLEPVDHSDGRVVAENNDGHETGPTEIDTVDERPARRAGGS